MDMRLFEVQFYCGTEECFESISMSEACFFASTQFPNRRVWLIRDVTAHLDLEEDEMNMPDVVGKTQVCTRHIQCDSYGITTVRCPYCMGVPHMVGTLFGPGAVENSPCGPGLMIESYCEMGHHWNTLLADKGGSTIVYVVKLDDVDPREM